MRSTDWKSALKEHNHVFAHAQEFDFSLGGSRIQRCENIELSQIRLHRPQLTLALPFTSQNQRSVRHGSRKVSICV